MAAIGILGGMGPQASNKLYELLIEKTARYTDATINNEDYPEIILLSIPVPDFISNKQKIDEAKQMLVERTALLEKAGCSVIGIACNTVHLLLPDLQAVTRVPFVSIPKLVDERIRREGFSRVGLLATPTTLSSRLYDDAINRATLVRPTKSLADKAETYIYKELAGRLTQEDRTRFRNDVEMFMRRENLDAVILGCTELPLVFGDSSGNPRVLDTLDILSDELLGQYFSD